MMLKQLWHSVMLSVVPQHPMAGHDKCVASTDSWPDYEPKTSQGMLLFAVVATRATGYCYEASRDASQRAVLQLAQWCKQGTSSCFVAALNCKGLLVLVLESQSVHDMSGLPDEP